MKALDAIGHLDFLVVGTGRSGSGWISGIFSLLGIPCGHEAVFNLDMSCKEMDGVPRGPNGIPLRGDSNHQAAPFLGEVKELRPDLVIFHQLRNPVDYVKSICSEVWLPEPSPNEEFMLSHVDVDRDDPIGAAMEMWVGWNHLISPHANFQYQVEELTPGLLKVMLGMLGEDRGVDEIMAAMGESGRNTHAKPNQIAIGDVWSNPKYEMLVKEAFGFGYTL